METINDGSPRQRTVTTMDVQLRAFVASPEEYQRLAWVHDAAWNTVGLTGEDYARHDAGRNPHFFVERVVALVDGAVVAHAQYGENAWNHRPGKYFIAIEVHPHYQRRGIGTRLYQASADALAVRHPPPTLIVATTREDQPGGLALLHKEQFTQVMRHPMSRINVQRFDAARFTEVGAKVRAAGITLHSMDELRERDPAWKRHWYDLELAINADHPMADRGAPLPFETFAAYLDTPLVRTDSAFFALDRDGSYVGQSTLNIPNAQSTTATVGMTGVVRSHRRRGIATALKVRTLQFAHATGIEWIETSNEEHNPMLQLNLRLGFEPAAAWLDFEKRM